MAFKSVRVDHACRLVDANTTTPFSTEATAPVFDCHQLFGERTLLKVKVQRIQTDKFAEEHVVRLLLSFEIVSKNETTFLACVTVQVNVQFQVAQLVLGNDGLLHLENSRLLVRARVQIEPVQIVIMRVQPVVPSRNSVRIDQGYYFYHVVLKDNTCLLCLRKDKVYNSIQDM